MHSEFLTELINKSQISLNSSGHRKHPAGYKLTKTIPDFDIICTISGCYTIIINSKEYIAAPMDSFLITPNSTLTLIANENSQNLFYHFSIIYADRINLAGDLNDYKLSPMYFALLELYKKHFVEHFNYKLIYQAAIKSVLKLVLLEVLFLHEENVSKFISGNPSLFNSQLINVIKYIHNNPSIPIKISSLAEMAGFNQYYFSNYFKKHIGISASDYICNVKMNAAKQMLTDKNFSVKETAIELGFSDQFTFSKKFKKHFGLSPSQLKKNNI